MSSYWNRAFQNSESLPMQEISRILGSIAQMAGVVIQAEGLHITLCPDHFQTSEPINLSFGQPDLEVDWPSDLIAAVQSHSCAEPGASAHPEQISTANGTCVMARMIGEDGTVHGALGFMWTQAAAPQEVVSRSLPIFQNGFLLIDTLYARFRSEFNNRALNMRLHRLQKLAHMDPLTHLENAASFENKARQCLAQAAGPVAIVVIDLDRFKAVNDLYGHQFGDTYLRTVAGALAKALPDQAIVGRVGGDEFAICMDLASAERDPLHAMLSFCQSAVMRAAALLGKPDLGRLSMGASLFPEHGTDYATLFELADAGLYAAKRVRRGSCVIFDPNQHQRFSTREVSSGFDEALSQEKIVPYFQPIVDLNTGTPVYFEVLARWLGPQGTVKQPVDFANLLTDYRFAERLTSAVVGKALRAVAQHRMPANAKLSVNLSALDLTNPEFVFEFGAMLDENGMDWGQVIFEVTEHVMLDDERHQICRTLAELRVRGAQVALDDFGTGYGGLVHLRNWPVDILKIDRGFVADLTKAPRDRVIVDAILDIARQSGYSVIAEGIETREQHQMLRDMGCDLGQGFYFATPCSVDDLDARYQPPPGHRDRHAQPAGRVAKTAG